MWKEIEKERVREKKNNKMDVIQQFIAGCRGTPWWIRYNNYYN